MSFDTLSIHCFLAVVETGSFTSAAQQVCRTQSAVSQQIAKMEKTLGVSLFSRGKKLSLTPDGEIFHRYARKIYALQTEVIDRFQEPNLEGEVRFGLPEDFATVFLSDVLAAFTKVHPRVFLHVECDFTLNLFDRFKKNEFDLVLVKMNRPQDFPYGVDVLSETLEWVGNPELMDSDSPIPLVLSPDPCVYRSRAINSLDVMGKRWRIVFSSRSYSGTLAAVRAGMGVTVLPRNMAPKNLIIRRNNPGIPLLEDTHISTLKYKSDNSVVNSLEMAVLQKMQHS